METQHEAKETQRPKFETLNYHTIFSRKAATGITLTALVPALIGVYFAIEFLLMWTTTGIIEEALSSLIPCLTCLVISFSLFYTGGLLLIISELIQCFLAIEENTYQSAQNTSYLHQEVSDET